MVSPCVATRVLHLGLFAAGFSTCILSVLIGKNYFGTTAGKRILTTNFDIRAVIYRGCIGLFCEDSGVFKFWIILGARNLINNHFFFR
jgi:hypothetical protein